MNESRDTGILDRLLEIVYLIQHDMDTSFAGTGLNPARVHLLWELDRRGPSTQQALAKALDVTPANITGLVDALQKHDFVERRAHPGDRRATLVTLTAKGETTMTRMAAERGELARALVADLDADARRDFRTTLDTVADRLRRLTEAAKEEP